MSLENLGFYSSPSMILPENNVAFLSGPLPMNSFHGVGQFQHSFENSPSPLLSKRPNPFELSDTLEKRTRLPNGAVRVEVIPVQASNVLTNDQQFYQIEDFAAQANWRIEEVASTTKIGIESLHWQVSQQNAHLKSSVVDPGLQMIQAPDMCFGEWSYPRSQPMVLQEGQLFHQSQMTTPKNNLNINGSSQIQFILAPFLVSLPPNPIIILDQANPLDPQNSFNIPALSSIGFDFHQNNSAMIMTMNQNTLHEQGDCFSSDKNIDTNLMTNNLFAALLQANNTNFLSEEGVKIEFQRKSPKGEKCLEKEDCCLLDGLRNDLSKENLVQKIEALGSSNGPRIKSFVDLMRRKKERMRSNLMSASSIEDKRLPEIKGAIEIKSFEFDQNPRKRRNLKLKWSPEKNGNEFLKLAEEVEKVLQIDVSHEKLTKLFQENDYNVNKTIELIQRNLRRYTKFFDLKPRRQRFPSCNLFSF